MMMMMTMIMIVMTRMMQDEVEQTLQIKRSFVTGQAGRKIEHNRTARTENSTFFKAGVKSPQYWLVLSIILRLTLI